MNISHVRTRASALYLLALLSAVNLMNALDKLILAILVEPIKAEFGLSDGQVGILVGLALAISTAIAMVPMGLLADRTNRRNLVACCLVVWSGVTALGGFAQSYAQLLASRVLVGIGEAGGGPPSLSMISDVFRREKRATASSVFFMTAPLGGVVALAAGGWIAGTFGWRVTLIAAGIPGVLIALLLVTTTTEPKRGGLDPIPTRSGPRPSLADSFRLIRDRPSLRHLLAAIALVAFAASGVATWLPAFYMRSHALPLQEVGPLLALVQGAAVVGPVLGALIADPLASRDPRWWCWIIVLGATIAGAALAVFTLTTDLHLALAFNCIYGVSISIWYGLSYGTVQSLVPAGMRATVMSIFYVVGNIVGFGFGTQFVGIMSDVLRSAAGEESLRYALGALSIVCFWSALHFALAARSLRQDLARRDQDEFEQGCFSAT